MTRRTALKSLSAAALTAWSAKAAKVSHRLIAQDKGVIAIIDAQGAVEWLWESRRGAHDLHLLPNGNVLAPTGRGPEISEVTPDKEVVWQWQSTPVAPYDGRIEIHGFERYANGNTMIAETGNMRVIEVDKDKKIVSEVKLTVDNPHYHRDTRLVRKTPAGTYLVPHEGDGVVREYNSKSEVIWEYRLSMVGPPSGGHGGHGTNVYSAYRLPSGNTLIGGGNNNRVLEVNPKGDIVWSIEQNELPGIKLFWVAQLQILPNGNVIVTNAHAGPENPQLFEITRNKEVVWQFLNWDTFGDNLTAAQILDAGPGLIR